VGFIIATIWNLLDPNVNPFSFLLRDSGKGPPAHLVLPGPYTVHLVLIDVHSYGLLKTWSG
jgi:hypothetical protein